MMRACSSLLIASLLENKNAAQLRRAVGPPGMGPKEIRDAGAYTRWGVGPTRWYLRTCEMCRCPRPCSYRGTRGPAECVEGRMALWTSGHASGGQYGTQIA